MALTFDPFTGKASFVEGSPIINQTTGQTLTTGTAGAGQIMKEFVTPSGVKILAPQNVGTYQPPTNQPSINQQQQQQQQPQTGDPALDSILASIETYIAKLEKQGKVINPYIEITPEKATELLSQAQTEISPYYSTQLKLARETLLRDAGYSTEEISRYETEAEKKYGTELRTLGETMAERGFALSGQRGAGEQDLARSYQQDIENKRRELEYNLGTKARTFAQNWGWGNMSIPTIPSIPQITTGESAWNRPGGNVPLYSISPETYSGLIGQKQYEEKAAEKTRAAELESAWKQNELAKQYRTLNL